MDRQLAEHWLQIYTDYVRAIEDLKADGVDPRATTEGMEMQKEKIINKMCEDKNGTQG